MLQTVHSFDPCMACACHMLDAPPWKALPTETTSIRVVGWHRPGGPLLLQICALHRQFRSVRSRLRGQLFFWFNGRPNKQIADKLSIAETTVKNHISNILSKLGANDRAHAVTIALQRGIIELDVRQR